MTTNVIKLSTYQKAVAKSRIDMPDANEEAFINYMLWELTQSDQILASIDDSIATFLEASTAKVYDLVSYKLKIA
jgi:hypothetical protein